VVLVVRAITFANDFDGLPLGLAAQTEPRRGCGMRPMGVRIFVDVLLCNVLSQRPVDLLNFGCVPVCG
jgi:hypothetical protein